MKDIVFVSPKVKEGESWDVIIIGSGPAALTAAVYTTRGAASTLVLGGTSWGGQLMLTTTVDNFPGFPDGVEGPVLMKQMREQAERFGTEFKAVDVSDVNFDVNPFEITADGIVYKGRSVIIATGADTVWLGIPGEDKLRGRGVSSCAPCDAPFFKDKEVVVVGGGDSAMEEALVLTKYATKVFIVHRRNEFRASVAMQKRVLENKNITVLWDTEITEMMGENLLESIKLKTKMNSETGKSLREGKIMDYQGSEEGADSEYLYWQKPVSGVFVSIGHSPSTKVFQGRVNLDKKGYVEVVSKTGDKSSLFHSSTNIPGVFVAGDVHDYDYKQAITASGFGCMAGMDALRFLDKEVPTW